MLRFIISFLTGGGIFFALWATLVLQGARLTYQSAQICNLARSLSVAAASAPKTKPTLYFLGGSSSTWGIQTERIDKAFPDINCRNFGFNGGIQFRYQAELIKPHLKTGDTVVLALEYELFENRGLSHNRYEIAVLLGEGHRFFNRLPLTFQLLVCTQCTYREIAEALEMRYHTPSQELHKMAVSLRQGINAFGDLAPGIGAENALENGLDDNVRNLLCPQFINGIETTSFGEIADFISWCRAREVTLLATYPPIHDNDVYAMHQQSVQAMIDRIADFYTSERIPIIEPADSQFYPIESFHNTNYHLTESARITRTERIINIFSSEPELLRRMPDTARAESH